MPTRMNWPQGSGEGSGSSTPAYIDGVELRGNKTARQLGLAKYSELQVVSQTVTDLEQDVNGLFNAVSGKVGVEEGKGLSTNDFSNSYKDKLDNLDNHVELTQAEYDALSDEEKNNGTIYFITDGTGGTGGGGESTIAWRPSVSSDGTITWTRTSSSTTPAPVNVKGEKGEQGEQGPKGDKGEDGVDGAKGDTGEKGDKGDTGEKGEKGDTGTQGIQGEKGDKGDDGFSPVITVTDITDGHRVTIVDEAHPQGQSFDVMDGQVPSGNFVTFNGSGCTVANINASKSAVNIDIAAQHEEYNDYNATGVNIRENGIVLLKRKASDGTWEVKKWWTADEDTGVQTLTGDYFDMFYRKKNGVVYIDFNASGLKQDIPVGYTTCFDSIPDAIKPSHTNISGSICNAQTFDHVGVYLIMTNGTIVFRMKTAMPANNWISQHVSYPV